MTSKAEKKQAIRALKVDIELAVGQVAAQKELYNTFTDLEAGFVINNLRKVVNYLDKIEAYDDE